MKSFLHRGLGGIAFGHTKLLYDFSNSGFLSLFQVSVVYDYDYGDGVIKVGDDDRKS